MPVPNVRARDLDWLIPSLAITTSLGMVSLTLMWSIGFSKAPDPIHSLGGWLVWTLISSCVAVIAYTCRLMLHSTPEPLKIFKRNIVNHWRRYLIVFLSMVLAGLDIYFFMLIKPELDVIFPFWADPMLADIDHQLLGTDAWRLFAGWNLELMAWIYSPGWFVSVLVTFFWILLKPPSDCKSTAILSYFILWSIFGPFGQAMLSSAGPIFYAQIGLGDRFNDISIPTVTRTIADYLWLHYEQRSLAPGAGISAMPSMHIASMAWVILSLIAYRSLWFFPALLLSLYIYVGSMALGWHYATDGVVGAVGAVICHYAARLFLRLRGTSRSAPLLAA